LKAFIVVLVAAHSSVCWTTAYASTEYNRYVTQIFQKYGSGDTISFEVKTYKFNQRSVQNIKIVFKFFFGQHLLNDLFLIDQQFRLMIRNICT